jgi:hypothetical protein
MMGYLLAARAMGTFTAVWDAVSGATSYVVQAGTATGLSDIYNANVGDALTATLTIPIGTYYTRAVVVGGAHNGELTTGGEQVVTV